MMEDSPHILVIDDDDRLRSLLKKFLTENDFVVITAKDAGNGRERLKSIDVDLIVLDLMMPGESGLAFAEKLRGISSTPILMLTAMSEAEDRIDGLEKGADDYLTKPFEPRELLLRIHSILRRQPNSQMARTAGAVAFGGKTYDLEREELAEGKKRIRLTEIETALLTALARRPGETFGRDDLAELTGASGSGRAVDVQVTRLRRKLEDDPRNPRYLKTVRGRGYVLVPD